MHEGDVRMGDTQTRHGLPIVLKYGCDIRIFRNVGVAVLVKRDIDPGRQPVVQQPCELVSFRRRITVAPDLAWAKKPPSLDGGLVERNDPYLQRLTFTHKVGDPVHDVPADRLVPEEDPLACQSGSGRVGQVEGFSHRRSLPLNCRASAGGAQCQASSQTQQPAHEPPPADDSATRGRSVHGAQPPFDEATPCRPCRCRSSGSTEAARSPPAPCGPGDEIGRTPECR